MILKWHWVLKNLFLFVLLSLIIEGVTVTAYANSKNPWQSFLDKDYRTYLQYVDYQIERQDLSWLENNFSRIVAIAIALNKEDNSQVTIARLRRHLEKSPKALRYFDAMQKLLNGEISNVKDFFINTPPSFSSWKLQSEVLRQHSYERQSNVMEVMLMLGGIGFLHNHAHIQQCIEAWIQLEEEDRKELSPILQAYLKPHQFRSKGIVEIIVNMVDEQEKKSTALTQLLPVVANQPGIVDTSHLQTIVISRGGTPTIALAFANHIVRYNPLLAKKVGLILQNRIWQKPVVKFYSVTLQQVDMPQHHSILADYVKWLAKYDNRQINSVVAREGSFGKALELSVLGRSSEAVAIFQVILRNNRLTESEHLAAFDELFLLQPELAVEYLHDKDFKKIDIVYLSHYARSLWYWTRAYYGKKNEFDDIFQNIVQVMHNMVEQRQDLLLRKTNADSFSLRVPLAVCYYLLDKRENAELILRREVQYEARVPIQAPPGMSPLTIAYKHQVVRYPASEIELKNLYREVNKYYEQLRIRKK